MVPRGYCARRFFTRLAISGAAFVAPPNVTVDADIRAE